VAFEEVANRLEVGVLLLDERHVPALLEDPELRTRDPRRHRLGRFGRAGAVVASGEDKDRVADLRQAVLELDRPVPRRREDLEDPRRVHSPGRPGQVVRDARVAGVAEVPRHLVVHDRREVLGRLHVLLARP
jgi:hypothetical protein